MGAGWAKAFEDRDPEFVRAKMEMSKVKKEKIDAKIESYQKKLGGMTPAERYADIEMHLRMLLNEIKDDAAWAVAETMLATIGGVLAGQHPESADKVVENW